MRHMFLSDEGVYSCIIFVLCSIITDMIDSKHALAFGFLFVCNAASSDFQLKALGSSTLSLNEIEPGA